jgi:hypothetical protein
MFAYSLQRQKLKILELNYPRIVSSILDLSNIPKLSLNWNNIVMMRESCSFILRSVGKLLSEGGQVNAIRELTHSYLNLWNRADDSTTYPDKCVLICALNEVSALLLDVRSAAYTVQDVLYESLVSLLSHSSKSINIALSWTFKCLSYSFPQVLPKLLAKLVPILERDSSCLSADKEDGLLKFSSLGSIIAGLVSVVSSHHFAVSFEYSDRIFTLATQLIMNSNSNIAVIVIQTQIETAWTLLSSLVTLGPNFIKDHLTQLLMFWKAVLTKSVSLLLISHR